MEVRPGDTKALNGYAHKPGIWARPPRIAAAVGRKRLAKAVEAGKATAPTTFNRRSGQSVTVPKVVNADVPRLLFLSIPKAEYQPDATSSWERAMCATTGLWLHAGKRTYRSAPISAAQRPLAASPKRTLQQLSL